MRRHRYQTKGMAPKPAYTLPTPKSSRVNQNINNRIVANGPKGAANTLEQTRIVNEYDSLPNDTSYIAQSPGFSYFYNTGQNTQDGKPVSNLTMPSSLKNPRPYAYGGPVKYQTKGAKQDNTTVNRVLPLEMEMANTANSRDEFGRTYPTQQNPGTLSAPVSLDPNSGFTRNAGESAAMSRYKEDVFKREMQGGFAGAGLGAASHYAGRGLRALRGVNKMRRPGPPNIMQEADRAFTPKGRPGPANVKPEFDKPLNMSGKELEKFLPEMIERMKAKEFIQSLNKGNSGSLNMSSAQLEKDLPDAIARMEAKKFLEEALKKKFKHGGAARRYIRY